MGEWVGSGSGERRTARRQRRVELGRAHVPIGEVAVVSDYHDSSYGDIGRQQLDEQACAQRCVAASGEFAALCVERGV